MTIKQGTDGRFVKGHSGGPGRPPKEREARYSEIMLTRVTYADWERIIDKAVDLAKRGDPAARKWLADYLIGPPVERREISGVDGNPIEFIEVVSAGEPGSTDD